MLLNSHLPILRPRQLGLHDNFLITHEMSNCKKTSILFRCVNLQMERLNGLKSLNKKKQLLNEQKLIQNGSQQSRQATSGYLYADFVGVF